MLVTNVARTCGNEFFEMFVDESDCEYRPTSGVAFLDVY